ncbi:MAG: hypothetical protein CVV11_04560 [Gammaproteobacteria bacterium HGW-Gammaproteobacteria-15]|nr:MAG: hypothetical protein CVV11_04560 [Gammaproteobacteria bacterium HGW-Gammaproteobacteria-15]
MPETEKPRGLGSRGFSVVEQLGLFTSYQRTGVERPAHFSQQVVDTADQQSTTNSIAALVSNIMFICCSI